MRVSISQPAFLPWLGYFHRIAISDLHIVLDHVQIGDKSFTNRNKIKKPDGTFWLTVPIISSGRSGDLAINKIEIANQLKWQKKITETIKQFYKKAPFFEQYFPFIEDSLCNHEWTELNLLLRYLSEYFLKELDIHTPLVYSSEIITAGTKSDLIYNLCKQYNTNIYISGPFGKEYLDRKKFEDAGMYIEYHEYSYPVYPQLYKDFVPYMSIIDLLFNCGKESRAILMSNK